MRGSSLTATAAAKPTPNLPTAISCASGPRLLEARSVDSAATPAASSGAPTFAATSVPAAQCQPQPARHSRARRRIGRVLRQLHHHAVPVAAERVVLLGVGVLTEPRGRRRPGIEHQAAQLRGAERVRRGCPAQRGSAFRHNARMSGANVTALSCGGFHLPGAVRGDLCVFRPCLVVLRVLAVAAGGGR